jgi:hypothetical protein
LHYQRLRIIIKGLKLEATRRKKGHNIFQFNPGNHQIVRPSVRGIFSIGILHNIFLVTNLAVLVFTSVAPFPYRAEAAETLYEMEIESDKRRYKVISANEELA